ncbi:LuxR family two component transcriptional regulator [Curtobacterium sp. PhB130]|uniref:response regulator transcription factor n=1 Tax=unclassified Curtobacterium TaxID=257496 RepID=UPI000F4B1D1A|nr:MULTISPECIES: response regulator transcription factor [unclassified Curtobacterium]ROS75844.1 LuxR family two component transcriptional regulator [Curtobacterium sp. PhB130]TCK64421.1 LuxR family two component transcriptional regulator [Curtobacterium sp. PhB136]
MRILVADDNVILREGLVSLLTSRGHEVRAVDSGDAAVQAVAAEAPEVVVMDIRMPPTHTDEGVHAAIAIKAASPRVGVLLFSQYAEARWARMLLDVAPTGVGYLLKERVGDIRPFLDSVQRVAAGGLVLDPEVAALLIDRGADRFAKLTAREREVLELMAEGRTNAAIADRMFLAAGTVEKHVTTLFTKLGLAPTAGDHRRVLAVLDYLAARP